jgi:hypothetical protein
MRKPYETKKKWLVLCGNEADGFVGYIVVAVTKEGARREFKKKFPNVKLPIQSIEPLDPALEADIEAGFNSAFDEGLLPRPKK